MGGLFKVRSFNKILKEILKAGCALCNRMGGFYE